MKRIAVLSLALAAAAVMAQSTTVTIPAQSLTGTLSGTTVTTPAQNLKGSLADGTAISVAVAAQTFKSTVVPPPVTGLHVAGNKILNSAGKAVIFRGVNKAGTEYQCVLTTGQVFDGPSDAASVTTLGTWAINIVRLPLNEDCWLNINGVRTGGAAYQSAISSYVTLLTNAGMAVILDLHWAAPGTTLANQQLAMPDVDHSPTFWGQVAAAYKGNGSVIFDLYNEPFPNSNQDTTAAWTCLRDGGTCPGITYKAAGMQSLVTAIRATGATNVIMVPGVQYTNTLSHWTQYKPVDPLNNLAASWHSYSNEICNTQSCWTANITPTAALAPLIAGEIGEFDCKGIYIDPLMAYMDGIGQSYVAWAWNANQNCSTFPALITATNGTPSGFGADYKTHLLGTGGGSSSSSSGGGSSSSSSSSSSGGSSSSSGGTAPAGTYWVYHNGAKQGVFDLDVSFAGTANYSDTVGQPADSPFDIAFTGSQYNGGWQLMSSKCQSSAASCLDTTKYKYLILQVKATVTGQKYQAGFMSAGDTPDGPVIDMTPYCAASVAGVWSACKAPLSAFKLTNTNILKFWWQGNTQGATKFYINDVGYSQ